MKNITLLTCALTTALALTACKKDKKEDKTATTDTAAADTAQKPTETAPPPAETPPPAEAPPPAEPPAPEKPASVTDDQVKMADDFVAAMDSAAAAAEGAKGDCKALAKSLTAESAKMKPMMKKLADMKKKNEKDTAARDWFKATYEPKVMASFGKLMGAVEPCKTDKTVLSALKSMGPPPAEGGAPKADAPAPSK